MADAGVIRSGDRRDLARSLPPDPRSAREARKAIVGFLTGCGTDDELAERAGAIVTELVTNAVLHAATPVGLTVRWDGTGVMVEVTDGSSVRPVPPDLPFGDAVTGRGLALVDALATAWGTVKSRHGKTVWVLIGDGDTPDDHPDESGQLPVNVVLCEVPIELFRRLIRHEEAIMREFELLAIGSAAGTTTGGSVPDALRDLIHRARAGFVAVLEPLRQALDGAGPDPVGELELRLAPSAPAALARYADLLARAETALSDQLFLTQPLDEEARALREWIVDEVRAQMVAHRPARPYRPAS